MHRTQIKHDYPVGSLHKRFDVNELAKVIAIHKVDGEYLLEVQRYILLAHFTITCQTYKREYVRVLPDALVKSSLVESRGREVMIETNSVYPSLVNTSAKICRWVEEHRDDRSGCIQRLQYNTISDLNQRSFRARSLKREEIELLEQWRGTSQINKKYTFADAFCGAGGTTRGAKQAGLKVKWAFDKDTASAESWTTNFPRAHFYHYSVEQLMTVEEDLQVDVLHLSPPCQGFSIMSMGHADGDKNGSENRALSLSLLSLARKVRPRVITIEQVTGLLTERYHEHFDTLIRTLIEDLSFSVRWAVLRCEQYGVPASRRRLIILAACPGQILPEFPEPSSEVRPVSHYLSGESAALPDFQGMFSGTLLASGASPRKFNGTAMTIEELAAIQAFPPEHIFMGTQTEQRRQIGNAVPPELARRMYISVQAALAETDAAVISRLNRGSAN